MTETAKDRVLTCWVVTDGRAGIEAQALGLANAIASKRPLEISSKRISVRAPWSVLPRHFWGDPFAKLQPSAGSLRPPFPDLWIGCGRLSVPLSIAVRKKNPSTFTVQLQNPRAPLGSFDLVIAPAHDRLTGANVISIIGSPALVAAAPSERKSKGAVKKAAVMIGGPNRAMRMTRDDAIVLAAQLKALAASGVDLAVTTSRRTPGDVSQILDDALKNEASVFWRADCGEKMANPYPEMLRDADAILVTEDSVNMAVEAAATGAPVHIIRLPRKPFASAAKFDEFHASLRERGAARYFSGAIEQWPYQPLNETARAADEVLRRLK